MGLSTHKCTGTYFYPLNLSFYSIFITTLHQQYSFRPFTNIIKANRQRLRAQTPKSDIIPALLFELLSNMRPKMGLSTYKCTGTYFYSLTQGHSLIQFSDTPPPTSNCSHIPQTICKSQLHNNPTITYATSINITVATEPTLRYIRPPVMTLGSVHAIDALRHPSIWVQLTTPIAKIRNPTTTPTLTQPVSHSITFPSPYLTRTRTHSPSAVPGPDTSKGGSTTARHAGILRVPEQALQVTAIRPGWSQLHYLNSRRLCRSSRQPYRHIAVAVEYQSQPLRRLDSFFVLLNVKLQILNKLYCNYFTTSAQQIYSVLADYSQYITYHIQKLKCFVPYMLTQTLLILISTLIPSITKNKELSPLIYLTIAFTTRLALHARLLPVKPFTTLLTLLSLTTLPKLNPLSILSILTAFALHTNTQSLTLHIPILALPNMKMASISSPPPIVILLTLAILSVVFADWLYPIQRPPNPLRLPPYLLLPWPLPHVAGRIKRQILLRWLNPTHPRHLTNAVLACGGSGRPSHTPTAAQPPGHTHSPPPIYKPL